ncbi:zinc finger and BTB domain-containing protein 2-like [Scleropages formosus]|uniref:Zinc finger and BTB domain containing 2a n=1 Tax=Scleropages formosus TaxID=113540 RepID=A0A0P7VS29_SCLFO|nr:zinc finger and BTB domain-containing protein 2-like [Scleropages formosus]XP_029114390.1 zinc finger and BTB domain-containing protein 2-like [Scleropages formosus]KPP79246.1 zinc finger and BTB domain-containing protein 2-like [Scleropages formosus]
MELANHGLVLLQQLNAQRGFGFLCDCTVAIGDVFFKAHKAVLAAFSNYFRMLFIHQDSDCVRLKPADIQPDIFSYLLNLMYTGKLAPQLIDPLRLEQGVKFLHAYPLLQEASMTSHATFSYAEQNALMTTSLYGIQISDQQAALSRSHLSSPFEGEHLSDGKRPAGEPKVADAYTEAEPPAAEEPVAATPAEGPVPNAILHVKPSIMKRSASFRKHYSCHLCGSRFNQRSLLREHLLLHAQASLSAAAGSLTEPGSSSPAQAPDAPVPEQVTRELEEAQRPCEVIVSDGEQPPAADSSPHAEPQQSQSETPPPSDIADIDNLESIDLEREVKRRKYECSTCGRKFIQKSHWREHMYIHTGKPYKCSACGKSFCRANQAARHVCLHQSAESYTMVNKQSMELCPGEDSSQVEALFLSSGRPYKCSVCEMCFSSPNEVMKHTCFAQNTQTPLELDDQSAMQMDELSKDEGSDPSDAKPLIASIKTEGILVD